MKENDGSSSKSKNSVVSWFMSGPRPMGPK